MSYDTLLSPFNFNGATVLITGGSSGIGLALVKQCVAAGSNVIVSGRREGALKAVQMQYPSVKYYVADMAKEADRVHLADALRHDQPQLNVVIHNAGIQRQRALAEDTAPWSERTEEIEINFAGPVHFNAAIVADLLKQSRDCAIIHVTGGLAFWPLGTCPVYCATKAAMHSYTMSLRLSLQHTKVRVVELIPPSVKSNLGGNHNFGEDTDEFTAAVFKKIGDGAVEVAYKLSETARLATRAELDEIMVNAHQNLHVKEYTQ